MKLRVNTLVYFVAWGQWYSMIFCLLIGTAFYPLLGAVVVFYSPFIAIGWFVCAWIVMAHFALYFSEDMDLGAYRRRVTRMIAYITLFIFIASLGFFLFNPHLNGQAGLIVMLASVVPTILWIGCAIAYTTRQYPLWIVQKMNTYLDPLDLPDAALSIASERERLMQHIHSRWIFALTGFPAAFAYLYHITSAQYLFPSPESTALLYFSFAIVACLFIFYCAQGNAALITFIKVLILEDYFPQISSHRHRIILPGISFLYTLVTTWWTLILAPLYAMFIAYHVYHTLALPHDGYDKAKRKEKVSAALVSSEEETA